MPVHPLKGIKVAVIRTQRDPTARSTMIIVEVPGEGRLVLPIEWTDRGPPWSTPTVDGREVRLSARGLLAAAQAVDEIRRKVGPLRPLSPASTEAERASKNAEDSSSGHGRDLGGADAEDATRSAGRVGKPDAQDAARKRGSQ